MIDGRKLASEIRAAVKNGVESLGFKPGLATILVGENEASKVYLKLKHKACQEAGFYSVNHKLHESASEEEVISLIRELNADPKIHGILVQLPLPKHINTSKVMEAVDPRKDVDGFHPVNYGRLLIGDEFMVPCTPKGVIRLLDAINIDLEGKEVVIVNHSPVVGKPLALLMMNRNATVTVCHVKTRDIGEHTRKADVLVVAAGVPRLIKADMVKPGSIVIDVGITRKEGRIVGDIDFDGVKDKVKAITPVPGGVGPMTIAMLLENTLEAAKTSL